MNVRWFTSKWKIKNLTKVLGLMQFGRKNWILIFFNGNLDLKTWNWMWTWRRCLCWCSLGGRRTGPTGRRSQTTRMSSDSVQSWSSWSSSRSPRSSSWSPSKLLFWSSRLSWLCAVMIMCLAHLKNRTIANVLLFLLSSSKIMIATRRSYLSPPITVTPLPRPLGNTIQEIVTRFISSPYVTPIRCSICNI